MHPLVKSLSLSACALAAALLVSACGGADPADTMAPTVVITDNVADSTATGKVTFTFTFSEDIKDTLLSAFTAGDVLVSGGTAGTFTKVSAKVYTLEVTPDSNAVGAITVSVAANKFDDLAGNPNTLSANSSQDFNTAVPTTAPTAPTAAPANVKSLYSDTYTTVGGFDIPYWGQGQMVSDVTVAGNKVLKGDQFTYQGFQFGAIDATSLGLTSMHIDVWSADATPVKAYVISAGQDTEYVEIVPTAGGWKGVDIPLSSFTKINKSAIIQVKLDTGIQPTTKVMYFDNIYFSGAGGGGGGGATAPTTAPTAPTAAPANVKSLYSDTYTTVGGFDIPYWGQGQMVSDVTVAGNKVLKGDQFTYQGFQFDAIDATSLGLTSMHIDVWSADATPVKAYVISAGQDTEYVEIVPTAGGWKGVDIPLSSFTKINKSAIIQVKLDTGIQPTTKVMYFDNIYFSGAGGGGGGATAPTTAPTAPTAAPANVKSLYSDTYTTVGGFDIPYWGQGQMVSDVTVAGNKVLKGDQFTYQGFQFGAIDATSLGLTSMHIDVWSADATPVKAYVISAGQDTEYVEIVPTAGGWKGVDIPLSSFTKINKSTIIQVKLDTGIQPTTKVMYFDNIYFSK